MLNIKSILLATLLTVSMAAPVASPNEFQLEKRGLLSILGGFLGKGKVASSAFSGASKVIDSGAVNTAAPAADPNAVEAVPPQPKQSGRQKVKNFFKHLFGL